MTTNLVKFVKPRIIYALTNYKNMYIFSTNIKVYETCLKRIFSMEINEAYMIFPACRECTSVPVRFFVFLKNWIPFSSILP